jgi:16S rRNA (adenine1518-N6/adenine1519-N6)-dimethyltransferase
MKFEQNRTDRGMKDSERQTRRHLMELFEQHGFNPRGDLGQNFLIDLNLVEYIVNRAHLGPNDVVLEVGAGTGGMTTFMAQQAAEVVSVEFDTNMHMLASTVVESYENVTLLCCDALRTKNQISPDVLQIVEEKLDEDPDRGLKLVSNLPYNIATPIISNLVATDLPWERMVVTIQLELGQRMTSRPGRSTYGALSIWLQSQCRVKLLKRVGPKVFWPRPKVESAIMLLTPLRSARDKIDDRPFFQDYLRRLFSLRRKMMRGVLGSMYRKQCEKSQIDEVLAELGHEPTVRAEALSVKAHVKLANRLHQMLSESTTAKSTTTEEAKAESETNEEHSDERTGD